MFVWFYFGFLLSCAQHCALCNFVCHTKMNLLIGLVDNVSPMITFKSPRMIVFKSAQKSLIASQRARSMVSTVNVLSAARIDLKDEDQGMKVLAILFPHRTQPPLMNLNLKHCKVDRWRCQVAFLPKLVFGILCSAKSFNTSLYTRAAFLKFNPFATQFI